MFGGLARARKLWDLANVGGRMYSGAVFFAVRVALDERAARRWLPPGVRLSGSTATATVFAAHFPETTFGSVYDEAGVFFHVKRRFRAGVFCPWMVVTDDVALVVGRELLGYPKKLAKIAFTYGEGEGKGENEGKGEGEGENEGGQVSAQVERRGRVLLRLRGRVGERVDDAPPMLGQRAFNVRGSLGLCSQRLVTFKPRERIVEARRATAEMIVEPHDRLSRVEEGRDPLDELGLGAVLGAHLYRVDVAAGLPPRELRRVGFGFALQGLGARWL